MNEQEETARVLELLRARGYYTIEVEGAGVFITGDRYIATNPDPTDTQILSDFKRKEGLRRMAVGEEQLTPEQRAERMEKMADVLPPVDLEWMTREGEKTWEWFWANASRISQGQAAVVRKLRCEERRSWRGVARHFQAAHWFAGWYSPASNQVAGMALCKAAAEKFCEDWRKDPWN